MQLQNKPSDLPQRITRARDALSYIDNCERESKAFPAWMHTKINAKIAEARSSANAALDALLQEFKGTTQ